MAGENRGNGIRELVNYTAALQIETLGASVKLWSSWLDAMASYGLEVSQSVARVIINDGTGADKEIGNLVKSANEKLKHLTTLPGEIGKEFSGRVSKRAGVEREKA